ncbi:MAG: hypothetical protein ACR2NP_05615, partial [Pirellulaceae bacterium]
MLRISLSLLITLLVISASGVHAQDRTPAIDVGRAAPRESKQAETEVCEINGQSMEGLVRSLRNREWRHGRLNAMYTIAQWAKRPFDHLDAYVEALDEPEIRASVIQYLGIMAKRFPDHQADVIPHLVRVLDDEDASV